MKKIALVVLALVLTIGFSLSSAQAGQKCWQLTPYADVIKVSTTSTYYGNTLVNGIQYVSGGYLLPLYGTMTKDAAGNKILALTMNGSAWALEQCTITVTLDPLTLGGPETVSCDNGTFTATSTFVKVPCSSLGPLSASDAPSQFPGN